MHIVTYEMRECTRLLKEARGRISEGYAQGNKTYSPITREEYLQFSEGIIRNLQTGNLKGSATCLEYLLDLTQRGGEREAELNRSLRCIETKKWKRAAKAVIKGRNFKKINETIRDLNKSLKETYKRFYL